MRKFHFILLLTLSIASPVMAQSQLLDRVVAVVNDEAITEGELDAFLRPIYEQLRQEFTGRQLMEELNDVRRKLISQLIEDRLVYQQAKTLGIEVSDSEIQDEMARFKKQFADENAMEETLRKEGLNMNEVKDRFKKQVMVRKLHDREVRSRVLVSPGEAEKYYTEHTDEFAASDEVRVRSMTIKKSDDAREKGLTDEAAKKKVEQLRERIIKGEDFGDLASKNSEDYQAAKAGLSEWIRPGSMIPVIDEVIFSLSPGDVSKVIETPMGYHFFRIEERKKTEQRNFEEVRNEIMDKLYLMKSKTRFHEWMQDLKRNAYISVR
jgi:peptidyl-prolyl cis-trans isomerase SurA